jgi:YjbR
VLLTPQRSRAAASSISPTSSVRATETSVTARGLSLRSRSRGSSRTGTTSAPCRSGPDPRSPDPAYGGTEPGIISLVKRESDDPARTAVELSAEIVERVSALCMALPEVTVRVDDSMVTTRSTAHSFDIRQRSFCLLVAVKSASGKPKPLLALRADPDEREALLSTGHPFFPPRRAPRDRLGVWLTDATDWEMIRELVTESYRVIAPKKLSALLD